MARKPKRKWNLTFIVKAWADIEVQADSIEEALAQVKDITTREVLDADHNDTSLTFVGVRDDSLLNKEMYSE